MKNRAKLLLPCANLLHRETPPSDERLVSGHAHHTKASVFSVCYRFFQADPRVELVPTAECATVKYSILVHLNILMHVSEEYPPQASLRLQQNLVQINPVSNPHIVI